MSTKKSKKEIAALMPEKVYNITGKKKMILVIVIAVALAFIVGLIVRGANLAIEFKGGTMMTYNYEGSISTSDIEKTVKEMVDTSVNVRTGESISSGDKQITISFTTDDGVTGDQQSELTA